MILELSWSSMVPIPTIIRHCFSLMDLIMCYAERLKRFWPTFVVRSSRGLSGLKLRASAESRSSVPSEAPRTCEPRTPDGHSFQYHLVTGASLIRIGQPGWG